MQQQHVMSAILPKFGKTWPDMVNMSVFGEKDQRMQISETGRRSWYKKLGVEGGCLLILHSHNLDEEPSSTLYTRLLSFVAVASALPLVRCSRFLHPTLSLFLPLCACSHPLLDCHGYVLRLDCCCSRHLLCWS